WDPQRRDEGGRSLYGATIRRLRHNGGRAAGLIWYQGESDAHAAAAPLYTARMKALVAAVRRDTKDPRLPIVIVQIGRVVGWGNDTVVHWNSIQDQQRRLADGIRGLAVVPCVDLALDDGIHIAGAEADRLGRRLAQAMAALRGPAQAAKLPIALGQLTVEWDRVSGLGNVVVPFENVHGKLISGSRPVGFSIVNSQAAIFDTVLDGTRVILRTGQSPVSLQGAAVHYGQGTDPICNITDDAGRAVPVFGPCLLGLQRALTPNIRELNVSALQPGAGQLGALEFPRDLPAIPWRRKVFAGDMCDLHEEIGGAAPQDKLSFFHVRFTASEPMRLAALLGYDGPVKVWADGQRLFHDPQGTNPAVPHARAVKFSVARGAHDLLVALGTNSGKAWGIFLQLERLDVSRARLRKGPGHYAMPQLMPLDNT
ncbi:MAG: sialate O-acetylesterase, partial [bacterium]